MIKYIVKDIISGTSHSVIFLLDNSVSKTISKDDAIATAKNDAKVAEAIEGKTIVKEIFVPGKIVNIVVK